MKRVPLFVLFLFCGMQVIATNIVIVPRTGAGQTTDLSIIGKLAFTNDKMQLLDKSGTVLYETNVADVQRILFAPSATTIENVHNNPDKVFYVYPNPTQDMLCVQGIENDMTIRVFSMTGEVILTTQTTPVDVSTLPNGTYLLQIGTQVARFIKQ